MKFLKYALATLLLAVIIDVTLVYAYASPISSGVIVELNKNNSQNIGNLTKTKISYQEYKNTSSLTWCQ